MLKLVSHHDGSLTITSDDADAENIRVADAFDGTEFELEWEIAPYTDGEVTLTVSDGKEALYALENEFPFEVDKAFGDREELGLDDD